MATTVDSARPGTHRLTVVEVTSVTPTMRRVTVSAPTLARAPLGLAQDVGLMLTDSAGRPVRRRYTITKPDAATGTLVLDGVLHGDGPGARWFADTRPGDTVDAFGPRSGIEVVAADWYLLCSDESGLPAVAELADRLPGPVLALLEVGDAAQEQPELAGPRRGASAAGPGRTLQWLHREQREPGRSEPFVAAIGALAHPAGAGHADRPAGTGYADRPAGTGYAYVLGESRAVTALKPVLAAAGFDAEHSYVKGYWNRPRTIVP